LWSLAFGILLHSASATLARNVLCEKMSLTACVSTSLVLKNHLLLGRLIQLR
jgi:hypothetical protein